MKQNPIITLALNINKIIKIEDWLTKARINLEQKKNDTAEFNVSNIGFLIPPHHKKRIKR